MSWIVGLKIFDSHNPTQPTSEKLMEHMINYCNENPVNHLDNTQYLEKIENKVNNCINPHVIYDD